MYVSQTATVSIVQANEAKRQFFLDIMLGFSHFGISCSVMDLPGFSIDKREMGLDSKGNRKSLHF